MHKVQMVVEGWSPVGSDGEGPIPRSLVFVDNFGQKVSK